MSEYNKAFLLELTKIGNGIQRIADQVTIIAENNTTGYVLMNQRLTALQRQRPTPHPGCGLGVQIARARNK